MSVSAPTTAAIAPVDQSTIPAAVQHGGAAARRAYDTGLGFEQMLVSELTQTMTATLSGGDSSGDSTDGSADGSSSGGLGAYASMLPNALTSGIMSSGGTGIAMQIARSIDPALNGPGDKASS